MEIKKGLYKHFKGEIVKVLYLAKSSETLEDQVVYKHEGTGDIWVRPASMWFDEVELAGKKYPRFKFIGENEEKK